MKVFAENRKARNSYEFLEFFEAGVVLTGPEIDKRRKITDKRVRKEIRDFK